MPLNTQDAFFISYLVIPQNFNESKIYAGGTDVIHKQPYQISSIVSKYVDSLLCIILSCIVGTSYRQFHGYLCNLVGYIVCCVIY